MKFKQKYFTIIFCVLSFVFLIHIGSTLGSRIKFDFSEEKLYSLSDGTKNVLKKLNTQIRLKLYYSKTAANKGTEQIRDFNNYYFYIKDLLEEYASHSRNNINLEIIDPRPDTVEEEEAQAYGLKRFQLTETESYFFGLVSINESGGESIIEFFNPQEQENLEYQLTKLIYTSVNKSKKSIGILSSLPVLNDDISPYVAQMMRMQGRTPQESWLFTKMLKEFYNVKQIKPDSEVIAGIDVLLVIHPKNFSEKTLYSIDQFVMYGGNLIVFIDPFSLVDTTTPANPMGPQTNNQFSNLETLMSKWNVKMRRDTFAGDKFLSGSGRMSPAHSSTKLLALMNCDRRCTSPNKDTISASLNQITLLYPGALEVIDPKNKNLKISPIISTTDKGNLYPASGHMLKNPQALWQQFVEGALPVNMGLKIIGNFKSAYPTGITVENKKAKSGKALLTGLSESNKESAIVVFSDVDFIHDQFAFKSNMFGVSFANDNVKLVLNTVEALAGNKDLLSVRSKGRFIRAFDIIDEIEFKSEKKTQQKVGQINANIKSVQNELNALGKQANAENVALLRNVSLNKKKELAKKVADLKRELRDVKRAGREEIEIIGMRLQLLNTIAVPILLLIFGFLFNRYRARKNKI